MSQADENKPDNADVSSGTGEPNAQRPLILFDGVCNFCNRWVNFVIDRDPGGFFRFASLQSEMGQRVLTQHGLSEKYLDSIVLVEIECPIKPC